MSIREQFKLLMDYFNRERMDYAVIGAFALYAYGYTRATRDIDFITRLDYQDKIITYLESLDFKTLQRSEGFSNHLYPAGSIRIDFLYIDNKSAKLIFNEAKKISMFENIKIPVVSPEHLIALKLFAIANDPQRKYKEFADIKELLRVTDVNREEIKKYFVQYQLEAYYIEITGEE
jgi:predicted nucleotidyltransferase